MIVYFAGIEDEGNFIASVPLASAFVPGAMTADLDDDEFKPKQVSLFDVFNYIIYCVYFIVKYTLS